MISHVLSLGQEMILFSDRGYLRVSLCFLWLITLSSRENHMRENEEMHSFPTPTAKMAKSSLSPISLIAGIAAGGNAQFLPLLWARILKWNVLDEDIFFSMRMSLAWASRIRYLWLGVLYRSWASCLHEVFSFGRSSSFPCVDGRRWEACYFKI